MQSAQSDILPKPFFLLLLFPVLFVLLPAGVAVPWQFPYFLESGLLESQDIFGLF